MLSEAQEVLRQFRQGLSGLRENDKTKINKLTFLARDHVHIPGFPQSVAEATVRHVYEIPANYKLLGLYVIDSIVKNVDVPYRKLFTDPIVPLFVHSFQMIRDEATRKRLFNLRTTWKDIFPFSKMRSLDIQVREHDPAWPLIPKDETQASNRIPSVPKISPTKISNKPLPVATSQLTIPVTEAVIAEARDPRRNKKRKSPQHECTESSFLIDRDGNRKMESIARKHGKVEEEAERQASKKPRTLFSLEDQDMRSVPRDRPSSPKLPEHGKYQDIDMRVGGASQSSMPRGGPRLPPSSPHPMAHSTTVDSVHLPRVASSECLPHRNPPSMHPRPPMHGPPSHFHRVGPQMAPHRPSPEHSLPPPPPTVFNRPHSVPPIRGPIWSVEIDGLSDMINIGIDPRMLSRVPNPKTARQITVDGRQYPLLLDRVQPLIEVEDQLHAVRFRCDSLAFIIDHQRFVIPGTGYTRIRAAGRERIAYLGGPGHELVIDGRPHTIPFNSHYATINIDHQTVSVMYACEFPQDVNVLPAIPPKILDWAYRGLFGSPGSLHLAPRNPLVELERQSEGRSDPTRGDQQSTARNRQPQITQRPTAPEEKRVQERNPGAPKEGVSSSANTAATSQINVQELLQKLIAAGIVAKPDSLPSLKEYNWEKFRQPFTPEIDILYSGFQCVQCGVRFESETSSDFVSHLDYHYMKNSAEHQEHRSRAFYQDSHCWLLSEMINEGAPRFTAPANTTEREEVRCPSFADEKLNECAVCGYKFDKVFDREEGEWMLQGAVIENGRAYHPICLEDAGKQFPVETAAPVAGSSASHDVLKEAKMEQQQGEERATACSSVSPAPSTSQLSVLIKSEPHIIETKNAIDTLNFSSSRDASDRLPSSSSCPVLSEITNVKREEEEEEEEEVKAGEAKGEPATLSLLLPPSSIPAAPAKCEPCQEELEANLGANSSPVVNIPGLSPTASLGISSCEDDLTTGGLEGGDGGSGDGVGVGDPLVTPASISSNPLAVLQAVLRGKAAIP
uniref:ENTH VHS domain containing protein n=1 Tax=Echinococcus granulosus TaxID=6210 RepID=A0A068WCV3_ECHGR|nr:ENTH VHS domain containing protein [Echinococcus granulosus]